MPVDYGLIGGIGQGIEKGLLAYQKQKQLTRENQIQNLTSGVTTDEDGNVQFTPEQQQLRASQQAKAQYEAADATRKTSLLKGGTPESIEETTKQKGFLNAIEPGLGDKLVNNQMSGTSAQDLTKEGGTLAGYLGKKYSTDTTNEIKKLGIDLQSQKLDEALRRQKESDERRREMDDFRRQMGESRLSQGDDRIHNANVDKVTKDPTATQLVNTTNNLNNAIANFQKGGATPQEFQELQQAVRSNLGIKGTSGVDERSETYLKSLGINADKIKQFFTGDPQSVMQSDPQFADQVIKVANLEIENKKKQYQGQVKKLTAAHKSFYKRHPELSSDFDDMIEAGNTQMDIPKPQAAPAPGAAPSPSLIGNSPQAVAPPAQGLVGNDARVAQFAKDNNVDYSHAEATLIKRGYKPNAK